MSRKESPNIIYDSEQSYSDQHVQSVSGRCVCHVCNKPLKFMQCFQQHVCEPIDQVKQVGRGKDNGGCCSHCGELFSNFSGFKVHQKRCASTVSEHPEIFVNPEMCVNPKICKTHLMDEVSLNKHQQVKHWKCLCLMCGFSTASLHYLKRHVTSHLGTRPYYCRMCDKGFEWKGYLKAHVKAVHENARPYCCQVCGKQFKQKTSLDDHNKSQHTGEKPYSCSKCPRAFVRVNSLREHMKGHLVVKKPRKQYSCNLCNDRPFLDKTCLMVHKASAHSNDQPYMCDICGRGFKLKNCLRVHAQTHSEERPYYCQLCDGTFKSKKDLKKHQERHKSSKDHFCNVCGKAFLTKNDVYLHQKVHDPTKGHRIYKPGKYKVSEGKLLTARTRQNKLSLGDQEPISFDTEINGSGNTKFGSNSLENQNHANSDHCINDVPTSLVSPDLRREAVSSQSLIFETFLDTSDDSNDFQSFHALDDAGEVVDRFVNSSADRSKNHPTTAPEQLMESLADWDSGELVENYDWLDAASPQGDTLE